MLWHRKLLRRLLDGPQGDAPLEVGANSQLQQKARAVAASGAFLGGPVAHYHAVGVHQLVTLLELGLIPQHKVLDVGCGCLRGGYWLIHFLDAGNYFGIEPNTEMLAMGLAEFVEPEILAAKSPTFDHNDRFDFGAFNKNFDFVIARSVWSHASPAQIGKMLDDFARWSKPSGAFVTSYHRAGPFRRQYNGTDWVGRSHVSKQGGLVRYRLSWIDEQCRERGLKVRELKRNMLDQIWLVIKRAS